MKFLCFLFLFYFLTSACANFRFKTFVKKLLIFQKVRKWTPRSRLTRSETIISLANVGRWKSVFTKAVLSSWRHCFFFYLTLKWKQRPCVISELATAVNYNINSTCEYAKLLFPKTILILIIESGLANETEVVLIQLTLQRTIKGLKLTASSTYHLR